MLHVVGITSPDDRCVAVRMAEREPQYQFSFGHSFGQQLIDLLAGPHFVERLSLNFRVRTTMGNPTSDNEPAPVLAAFVISSWCSGWSIE